MQSSIITVQKAFDNQDKSEHFCQITLETPGNFFKNKSRKTFLVSKRIWIEMGKVMEWME